MVAVERNATSYKIGGFISGLVSFGFKGLMVLVLALSFIVSSVSVSQAATTPLDKLRSTLVSGKSSFDETTGGTYYVKATENSYTKEGGGYYLYGELTVDYGSRGVNHTIVDEEHFQELTPGARRQFLTDMIKLGNGEVAYYKTQKRSNGTLASKNLITESTLNQFMTELQGVPGAGSQLIATLMAETKPDYVTANRIYKPISGPINTILGILSILIMALLGVTMALDLAFITIPAFQVALDGGDGGNDGKGGKGGFAKIISQEARNAVKAAENGGDGGQSGSGNKLAVGVYFKHRWKGLVILGICLLYLVQGQIYSFVAWVLDIVSGFVGF